VNRSDAESALRLARLPCSEGVLGFDAKFFRDVRRVHGGMPDSQGQLEGEWLEGRKFGGWHDRTPLGELVFSLQQTGSGI